MGGWGVRNRGRGVVCGRTGWVESVIGVLEWRGSDIPVSSVGWNGAVEGGREELRMGESLISAMGCV